jgi:hypothetical protein
MATRRVIEQTGHYPLIWPEFSIYIPHSQVEYPLFREGDELEPCARLAKLGPNA